MRYVALLIVFASIPVLISFLRTYPQRRPWALTAIGLALLLGDVQIGSYVYGWATWPAPVRGLEVSLIDSIAVALLVTRVSARRWLPFWGVFAFYGLALALSVLSAQLPVAAVFACWQFLRLILLFAAVAGECHRPEAQRALVAGLAVGALFQAGYVISQKLGGAVQAVGTVGHQNILGMMVELSLLPMLASLLAGDRRKLVVAGMVAFLIVMAGGGSRGTIVFGGAGVLALILLSLARGRTPGKLRVAGIGLLALLIATPFAVGSLQERFGSVTMITTEDESREALKRAATLMAADHPFGVGANQFVSFSNQFGYALRAGQEWGSGTLGAPVHQAYLLARAETGWLGEFALILLLVVPISRGAWFAFSKRTGAAGEIALGSAVAITVNLIHNNYEYVTHRYNVFSLLVINIAILAALIRAQAAARRPRPAGNAVRRPLGPAAAEPA